MSVQQCLACNAMVSLPCVVDSLLLARTSFSVVSLNTCASVVWQKNDRIYIALK